MILFETMPGYTPQQASAMLGFIPQMLTDGAPLSAIKQLDYQYQHGGGWRRFGGFTLDRSDMSIKYPGDPKYLPVAKGVCNGDEVYVYPHAWVMVLKSDGTHEISRMD
jgi:hypothetical protein